MIKKELQEIGKKLDVSRKDIKDIREICVIKKIFHWILGVLIGLLSLFIGYRYGRSACSGLPPGYPYAVLALPGMMKGKKARSKIAILLVSALAFFVAIKASPVFGEAIKYNVYKK